jgi:hypothetical protein
MLLSRATAFVASIFLGLSGASAQQAAAPPVFQGLMVDAKGKTVGRIFPIFGGGTTFVVLPISKIWVSLEVVDLTSGFAVQPPSTFAYYYQSVDCAGQAYLPANNFTGGGPDVMGPAPGVVSVIPPATAPSIYFAGAPMSVLTMHPTNTLGGSCYTYSGGGQPMYVGPAESFPVSSLKFTLPFSIK